MNDSNIIEFTKPLEPYQHDMLQAASLVLSAFDASSRIHADNFVYHYTSADGLMGILNSRSLWFTDYNSLNDESEGQYIFSLARQILSTSSYPEEYKNNVRWVLFDNEGYRLAPIKSNVEKYFICSFSCNKDSMPLWNYYTKNKNATGYNLEFNTDKLKNLDRVLTDEKIPASLQITRVLYNEERQHLLVKQILDYFLPVWTKYISYRHEILMALLFSLEINRFKIKHPAFMAENEVRLFINIKEESFKELVKEKNKLLKIRNINGIFTAYFDIPFNIKDIISLTVSPTIKNDYAISSMRLLLDSYGLVDTTINKSQIPLRY